MKIGKLTRPNQKGQIVIPKEFRKALGINKDVTLNLILKGEGIYIFPFEKTAESTESTKAYIELLKKTQGSWGKNTFEGREKNKRNTELKGSSERKKAW